MGEPCSTHTNDDNACILIGRPERNIPLGRLRRSDESILSKWSSEKWGVII